MYTQVPGFLIYSEDHGKHGSLNVSTDLVHFVYPLYTFCKVFFNYFDTLVSSISKVLTKYFASKCFRSRSGGERFERLAPSRIWLRRERGRVFELLQNVIVASRVGEVF